MRSALICVYPRPLEQSGGFHGAQPSQESRWYGDGDLGAFSSPATLPSRALMGFLSFEIDLFKEKEAAFARRDQIQVPVAVDVQRRYLHAASRFASVVDDMFDESTVPLGPVPVEAERLVGARVDVVSEVALSGHDIQPPVLVHVGEGDCVRLGPTVVDQMFVPPAGAVLEPENSIVVTRAVDQIVPAVLVDIVHVNWTALSQR